MCMGHRIEVLYTRPSLLPIYCTIQINILCSNSTLKQTSNQNTQFPPHSNHNQFPTLLPYNLYFVGAVFDGPLTAKPYFNRSRSRWYLTTFWPCPTSQQMRKSWRWNSWWSHVFIILIQNLLSLLTREQARLGIVRIYWIAILILPCEFVYLQ